MTNLQLTEFQRIFEEQLAGGTVLEWPEYDAKEDAFILPDELEYPSELYEFMQAALLGYQWGLVNASV